ncbi:unnamed protein product [Cyprideis torosa]|uniref:Uncharacterized protein n=1 Tax=Cyprideis torosa TaxID=163714 RepID=A0A7R8W357_9CRUS|nr:unnamed protein product [Cyprideis torosa]CAG0879317.1 unnamed protein product [Cyprideis torosa]
MPRRKQDCPKKMKGYFIQAGTTQGLAHLSKNMRRLSPKGRSDSRAHHNRVSDKENGIFQQVMGNLPHLTNQSRPTPSATERSV